MSPPAPPVEMMSYGIARSARVFEGNGAKGPGFNGDGNCEPAAKSMKLAPSTPGEESGAEIGRGERVARARDRKAAARWAGAGNAGRGAAGFVWGQ